MTASLPRAAAFAGGEVGRHATLNSNSAIHRRPRQTASFLPGPVLLLGAPGVGKGTQAQLLVASSAFRRSPPATCFAAASPGSHRTGDDGRQADGAGAAGAGRSGEQDGGGAAGRAGHGGADTSWMAFRGRWPRPTGWTALSAGDGGLPPTVAIETSVTTSSCCAGSRAADLPQSAIGSTTSTPTRRRQDEHLR